MRKTSKPLIIAMCALVAALGVNATVAWLTDTTDAVENTFTVGDINIELTETGAENTDSDEALENAYKMVPGNEIAKDPTVTVKANSEDCYLFVQVDESSNLGTYIDYDMAGGWQALEGVAGVYYREVAGLTEAGAVDAVFDVIGYTSEGGSFVADKVLVKTTVTKSDMEALQADGAEQPALAFKAFAVQKANIADAATAWGQIADSEKLQ